MITILKLVSINGVLVFQAKDNNPPHGVRNPYFSGYAYNTTNLSDQEYVTELLDGIRPLEWAWDSDSNPKRTKKAGYCSLTLKQSEKRFDELVSAFRSGKVNFEINFDI